MYKKDFYISVNEDWECKVSHLFQDEIGASPHKCPIILCHGIATNGECFDLVKEISLVDYLISHQYHVYNLNLRGVGGSFCKNNSLSHTNFNFDDLLSDIPFIINFILKYHKQYSSKNETVYWLGHSMGALLMYAFLSKEKKNKNLIQSFIALGSPTELKYIAHPVLLTLLRFRSVIYFYLKVRKIFQYFSFVLRYFNTKYHNLVFNKYAVNKEIIQKYLCKGIGDVPLPLLHQFSEWIINEEMNSVNGKVSYNDMGKNIETPILLMSGSYDSLCPPHALLKTYLDIPLPTNKKKMVILSKISGFSFDYCHVGIIMGKKSRDEVFPIIVDWLDQFHK